MENEPDVAGLGLMDYDSTSTDEEALGLNLGMCTIFLEFYLHSSL